MNSIYHKIIAWCENRIHEKHMHSAAMTHDRKCLGCKRWYSVVGCVECIDVDEDCAEITICGSCGHGSKWFMGSMLPIPYQEIAALQPATAKREL